MQTVHPNEDSQPSNAPRDREARSSPREQASERDGFEGLDGGGRRGLAQEGFAVRSGRGSGGGEREVSSDDPQRERALLALVSSARHELRSPLQSIQGFADLLASESYGALGRDQRVFVEHIIQGSWDLSRALDACFELIQAEALHLPTEPLPASLRKLLEESLTIAENNGPNRFDLRFSALADEFTVELDLHDFSKAVEAVITALAPLARGRISVSAALRPGLAELTFAVNDEPRSFRALNELPRRGVSARALLWLRLAAALLSRSQAKLETSESYDQVRVLLPEKRG